MVTGIILQSGQRPSPPLPLFPPFLPNCVCHIYAIIMVGGGLLPCVLGDSMRRGKRVGEGDREREGYICAEHKVRAHPL